MSSTEKRPNATRQRKSTLTQQQKNKKRQRATPQQLSILRSEFLVNSTPNAKTREEIGQKIDMTERSVQIWFQNKRAKAKQFARRHNPNFNSNTQFAGNFYISPTLSPMSPMANSQMGGTDAAVQNAFLSTASLVPFNPNMDNSMMPEEGQICQLMQQRQGDISIPCNSLNIGSWRRVSSAESAPPNNLLVTYSSADSSLSYTMFADYSGYQIKMPMCDVKSIHYSQTQNDPCLGELYVQLVKPPTFLIQSAKTMGEWVICLDFSEMKQASYVLVHKLSGPALELQMQLELVSRSEPKKITGIEPSRSQNKPVISPYLEMPVEFHTSFGRVKELGRSAGELVTKSEAQSPVCVHGDKGNFGSPVKVRSMSVPTVTINEEPLQHATSDEELIYTPEKNLCSQSVEDNSSSELEFPLPLFNSSSNEWDPASNLHTPSMEVPIIASCDYFANDKLELFSDEFIDFADSTSIGNTVSSSAPLSTNTNDSSNYGYDTSPLKDTDKLLITTSANLGAIDGNDYYTFDEQSKENDAGNVVQSNSDSNVDNIIESFNGDNVLLALIA